MACPLCGENCSCVSGASADARRVVRPRFELDDPNSPGPAERALIDPETPDLSEQTFAASLEDVTETPRPRFVVDQVGDIRESAASVDAEDFPSFEGVAHCASAFTPQESATAESFEVQERDVGGIGPLLAPSEESWRDEVSARLKRYQARRRPREPRYPSLRLKFETAEPSPPVATLSEAVPPAVMSSAAPAIASRESVAMDPSAEQAHVDAIPSKPALPEFRATTLAPEHLEPKAWSTAKIIEFPGPAYMPPVSYNELAEPVVDRPRILEAPEVVTPPPALGGILIEEDRVLEPERRPGIDMPLQAAPMNSRILSAVVDLLITLLACGVFGAIFYRITGVRPPLWQLIGLGIGLPVASWMAYQYLLVVYSGTTPGLLLAKLQLMHFDGTVPGRRRRRARVLASFLSGVSLGLGYLWQFLDEDALCWHDRVMKTYLAPGDRSSGT